MILPKKLESNGAPGFGAGATALVANTVVAPADAVISATDKSQTGTQHGINIAAETLIFSGGTTEVLRSRLTAMVYLQVSQDLST